MVIVNLASTVSYIVFYHSWKSLRVRGIGEERSENVCKPLGDSQLPKRENKWVWLTLRNVIVNGSAREASPPPGREELTAAVKTNAMDDLCDPKEGTRVFHATSTDESNPPEAIIDGCVLHVKRKCSANTKYNCASVNFLLISRSLFLYCTLPRTQATRTLSGWQLVCFRRSS